MESNKETFEFTYSPAQQEEIEKIRAKYLPKSESKLEQLRKLDESVTRPGSILGLTLGIIGCLTFGGAMSIVLVVGMELLVPAIILGILGAVLMGLAYPIYKKVTDKEKERLAPQILALTEELSQ